MTRLRCDLIVGAEVLAGHRYVSLVQPLGYLEFLGLMDRAAAILTDSGGIQEESVVLGVPCVTLRTTTERPVTLEMGQNVLVGDNPADGVAAIIRALGREDWTEPVLPPKWDGRAAERLVATIARWDTAGRPRRTDGYVHGAAGTRATMPAVSAADRD